MTKEDQDLLVHYTKIMNSEAYYSIGPSKLEVIDEKIVAVIRIPVFGLATAKRDYETGNHVPIKNAFSSLGKKIQEMRSLFKTLP